RTCNQVPTIKPPNLNSSQLDSEFLDNGIITMKPTDALVSQGLKRAPKRFLA
ncbi:MAG: hypothetical protein RLZ06_136, partial [Actinomycetota bacterium]